MSEFLNTLLSNEERASNVIIWGAAAIVAIAFVAAIAAMLLLK